MEMRFENESWKAQEEVGAVSLMRAGCVWMKAGQECVELLEPG